MNSHGLNYGMGFCLSLTFSFMALLYVFNRKPFKPCILNGLLKPVAEDSTSSFLVLGYKTPNWLNNARCAQYFVASNQKRLRGTSEY